MYLMKNKLYRAVLKGAIKAPQIKDSLQISLRSIVAIIGMIAAENSINGLIITCPLSCLLCTSQNKKRVR